MLRKQLDTKKYFYNLSHKHVATFFPDKIKVVLTLLLNKLLKKYM